jgi:hypothetical protein
MFFYLAALQISAPTACCLCMRMHWRVHIACTQFIIIPLLTPGSSSRNSGTLVQPQLIPWQPLGQIVSDSQCSLHSAVPYTLTR